MSNFDLFAQRRLLIQVQLFRCVGKLPAHIGLLYEFRKIRFQLLALLRRVRFQHFERLFGSNLLAINGSHDAIRVERSNRLGTTGFGLSCGRWGCGRRGRGGRLRPGNSGGIEQGKQEKTTCH